MNVEPMDVVLISSATVTLAIRFMFVRWLWRLPLKNGEGFFLAQSVGPGFYQESGASLLQRYHRSLFLPLVLDAPLVIWLAASQRLLLLSIEQWLAMLASFVVYNVIAAHFSSRATAVIGDQGADRPTDLQLSMAPRRLRDHSNRLVEIAIWASILAALILLAAAYGTADNHSEGRHALHEAEGITIWFLYLELGLILLKVVFVRWRMALPIRRTEDYKRWRSAWLSYHLKLFDSIRLMIALLLLSGSVIKVEGHGWTRGTLIIAVPGLVVMVVVYIIYIAREGRRLAAVQREVKPVELVKEFPLRPVPEGRFFGGGVLYFNRDNPVSIVRSAQGIAINLAHPTIYAWVAYFIGLAALSIWLPR